MVDDANETGKEAEQSVLEESAILKVPQNGESRQSIWKRPERRLILAAIMALAAIVTTLFPDQRISI